MVNKKNQQKEKFSSYIDDKKITEEEDRELYGRLKEDGFLIQHDFKWCKEHIMSFPPVTAPGIVRRTWRKQLENATPEQRRGMLRLSFAYEEFMNPEEYGLSGKGYSKASMPNSLSGYLDFMKDIKRYIEKYNIPSMDGGLYESMRNTADDFESELKKYI